MKNHSNKMNSGTKSTMRGLPNAPMAMPAQSLERRRERRISSPLPFTTRIVAK